MLNYPPASFAIERVARRHLRSFDVEADYPRIVSERGRGEGSVRACVLTFLFDDLTQPLIIPHAHTHTYKTQHRARAPAERFA